MSEKTKPLTIKDLKSMAFDIDQRMKQLQQEYNNILRAIVEKQDEVNDAETKNVDNKKK